MENITNIKIVNSDTLEYQNYQQDDNDLISDYAINDIIFTSDLNKIEYHVLDSNKNIISSNYDFKEYISLDNLPTDLSLSFSIVEILYFLAYALIVLL